MTIRVLPSKVGSHVQLLGAVPKIMDLSEVIPAVKAGTLDAQENPFLNTVTYGVHNFHKFHTASNHFYLSRQSFCTGRRSTAGRVSCRTKCERPSPKRSLFSATFT